MERAKQISRFWWDVFHYVNSEKYEDASFQIYVEIGRAMIDELPIQPLAIKLAKAFDVLATPLQLTTGLSLERLWRQLRPRTAATLPQLQSLDSLLPAHWLRRSSRILTRTNSFR